MFHVELRQFPHQARLLNLSREELHVRILTPWVNNQAFEHDEHRWVPDRTKLVIYEAPALAPEQIGMGRGWANVTRSGADVTAKVLAEAQGGLHPAAADAGQELREEILVRCATGAIPIRLALTLAGEQHPEWRVSERLALAEQTVWELLHRGRIRMVAEDRLRPSEDWQAVLLDLATWLDPESPARLEIAPR